MKNFWIGIIVFLILSIAQWYVQGGFVDESDFEEVVENRFNESEITHQVEDQEYGIVVYKATSENESERQNIALFRKYKGEWGLSGTSAYDDEWGFFSSDKAWVYFGLVTEPSVEKVFVGDEPVTIRSGEGSARFWYYIEPNGYNYPIKEVRSDGSEFWIKEK